MPRSRNVDKVSSQTSNGSQNKRTAKAKNKKTAKVCTKSKKQRSNSRNMESDVLTQMKERGYVRNNNRLEILWSN